MASADASVIICITCRSTITVNSIADDTTSGTRNESEKPFDSHDVHIDGFEITGVLGRGGMGVVLSGVQTSLGRNVAIKLLADEFTENRMFVDRFEREAKALASLSHPNIISVYDRGRSGSTYYFIMELVPHPQHDDVPDLTSFIRKQPSPLNDVLRYTSQIANALEHAHNNGIVHRDIKPSNILLDPHNNVKIADFGIASLKKVNQEESQLTALSTTMGTLDYMAPEQRKDAANVDGRADIYSFGIMLYEMLTGILPEGAYTPPSQVRDDLSSAWDQLIENMLRPTPSHRLQNASDITHFLETLNSNSPLAETNSCVSCGRHFQEQLEFCPECGASQFTVCETCDAKFSVSDEYCTDCGNNLWEQSKLERFLADARSQLESANHRESPLKERYESAFQAILILSKSKRLGKTSAPQDSLIKDSNKLLGVLGMQYAQELRHQNNLGLALEILESTIDASSDSENAEQFLKKIQNYVQDLDIRKQEAFAEGNLTAGIRFLTTQVELFPDNPQLGQDLEKYSNNVNSVTNITRDQIPALVKSNKWWEVNGILHTLSEYDFQIKGFQKLEEQTKKQLRAAEDTIPKIKDLIDKGLFELSKSRINKALMLVSDHPELLALQEKVLNDASDSNRHQASISESTIPTKALPPTTVEDSTAVSSSRTDLLKAIQESNNVKEADKKQRAGFNTLICLLIIVPILHYGLQFVSDSIVAGIEWSFVQRSPAWQYGIRHGVILLGLSISVIYLRNYSPRFRWSRWFGLISTWSIALIASVTHEFPSNTSNSTTFVLLAFHYQLLGAGYCLLLYDFMTDELKTYIKLFGISAFAAGILALTHEDIHADLYLRPATWLVSWLVVFGIIRRWLPSMILITIGGFATLIANGFLRSNVPFLNDYGNVLTIAGYSLISLFFLTRVNFIGYVLTIMMTALLFSPITPAFPPSVTLCWICTAGVVLVHNEHIFKPRLAKSPNATIS